jgi:hypothetical protein
MAVMWIWRQRLGVLYHNDVKQGEGYSGAGVDKNQPASQELKNKGPIPAGVYGIGPPHRTDTHGDHVLSLTPWKQNYMFGRDAFLIHGDSIADPGTASEGCVILSRALREQISNSGDTVLVVLA